MSGDLIGQYLRELRAKLRVKDAGLILAEAEDHLRGDRRGRAWPEAVVANNLGG